MSLDANSDARRQIAEKAAFWLMTLQTEEVAAAQRAEFVDWLRASPVHISEMLRICKLQRHLSDFKDWQQISSTREMQATELTRLLPAAEAASARRFTRRPRGAALLAAGVAAITIGIIGVLTLPRLNQTEFKTQLGEQRQLTLADQSVIDLSPGSDLIVRYRPSERLITLLRGEALFRVAKNPNRPFIVQAAQTRIRAVGTVFHVDRNAQGVSVAVVEGRVAVSSHSAARFAKSASEPGAFALSLQANEKVSINPAGVVSEVRKLNGEAEGGSGTDDLTFENETVGEIARRFNLYNSTQIDIVDAKLAARRISGEFRGSDPQSFISFIQAVADVRVSHRDLTHIVLASPNGESKDTTP